MKPIRKEDIAPEVFDLYDQYAHNQITRGTFMKRLSAFAVGGLTLSSLSSFMMPDYESYLEIKPDDPRLQSEYITYESPDGGGKIKALLSKPKDVEKALGGIVVVHENRGLNPYIEDTARKAALAGFFTLAPDALSPLGGYPGNDDEGRTMQKQRDREKMLQDFIAAYHHLEEHPDCNGKVGVVGFCFGGWVSNMMAVRLPGLDAAVPFYGGQPKDNIEDIQAPLQLHFASLDKRVNAGWPDYKAELEARNKEFEAHFYEGVNHGFHNNTTPRYDEKAAKLAWERTLEFFEKHLSNA